MLSAYEVNDLNLIWAFDQSSESFSPDNTSTVLDVVEIRQNLNLFANQSDESFSPDNSSTVLGVVEIGQRPKLYANYLSLHSDPETGQGPLSFINFLLVRLLYIFR